MLTEEGVKKARTVKRVSKPLRWDAAMLAKVRGSPWDPQGRNMDKIIAMKEKLDPGQIRGVYITEARMKKYGRTKGCPGCYPDDDGDRKVHSAGCRDRFRELAGSEVAPESEEPPVPMEGGETTGDEPMDLDAESNDVEMGGVVAAEPLRRSLLRKQVVNRVEPSVKYYAKKQVVEKDDGESPDAKKPKQEKEDGNDVSMEIFSLEELYEAEELEQQWTIERDRAVIDLTTTNTENLDQKLLEAARNDELDRVERFAAWSKFRVGERAIPGWDGKIYDCRWVDKLRRDNTVR